MILGIGTDLIEVARIERAYGRQPQRFIQRVLAPEERLSFALINPSGQARFLAKRWSAKEALAKALGWGVRPPLTLAGIAVVHDSRGRPQFQFEPAIASWLERLGAGPVHLSISDERLSACAFVIVESAGESRQDWL